VVPEGEVGRYIEDTIRYNKVAKKIMDRYQIAINDLYALSKSFNGAHSKRANDVHFTKEGSDLLAKQVAEVIAENLPQN